MDTLLTILAVFVLGLKVIDILFMPLVFGTERDPYSYKTWIYSLIGALLVVPLALRILGWI